MTLFLHAWLLHRAFVPKILRVGFFLLLVNLPWIAWFGSVDFHAAYLSKESQCERGALFIGMYAREIAANVFPYFLGLLGALVFWNGRSRGAARIRQARETDALMWIGLFLAFSVIVNGFLAPAFFFRFLAPAIPFLAMAAAYVIDGCMEVNLSLGILAFCLALSGQPLRDYAYEITHPFWGPVEGIVEHLKRYARPEDTVLITYDDLPLKFYTSLRVLGGLTGEDLVPAKAARWIIVRKYTVSPMDAAVKKFIVKNIRRTDYRAVPLPCPDTPFENREDLSMHYFRTVQNESPVVIFERIKPN